MSSDLVSVTTSLNAIVTVESIGRSYERRSRSMPGPPIRHHSRMSIRPRKKVPLRPPWFIAYAVANAPTPCDHASGGEP